MGPLKLSDKGHPQLKDPQVMQVQIMLEWQLTLSTGAWWKHDFWRCRSPKGLSISLSHVEPSTMPFFHTLFTQKDLHISDSDYHEGVTLWVCLPMHVPVYFPPNKHYIFSLKKKKSYTILQETIWQYIFRSWNISSLDLLIQLLEISVSVYTSSTYMEFYNFHLFMHLRPSVTSCFRANLYFHRSRHFLHLTWFFP